MVPDIGGVVYVIMFVMGVLVLANFLFPFVAGVLTGLISRRTTVGQGTRVGVTVGGFTGLLSALIVVGTLQGSSGDGALWFITLTIPIATIISVVVVLKTRKAESPSPD